ncbi:Oligopeptide transport system permease protein AppC [Azospirillaceae bacterium]
MTVETVLNDDDDGGRTEALGSAARCSVARRFLNHRLGVLGAAVLGVLIAAAAAAPLFEAWLGCHREAIDLTLRLAGPSWEHPLGADELGRDLLLRLLYGGRVSLFVGLVAALISSGVGASIGLTAGYLGGRVDAVLMRLTDAVIALPMLPLLIVLAAADPSRLGFAQGVLDSDQADLYRIILIVAFGGWTTVARLVRGATLAVRQRDFVRAAEAMGARPLRLVRCHILPNVASPIVVATTLAVGNIILLESVLSFLGLGIQPPTPSWGNMLTNAQELLTAAPVQAVWPGALIFVTVIAFNLLGDALQDALDPRA